MKITIASMLLGASLSAQLPPIPAQSYYAVGKGDWVTPCADYIPYCHMSAAPWSRTIDPAYPGSSPTQSYWGVDTGGTLYLRSLQHAVCPHYMPIGTSLAPYFLFGPRTNIWTSVAAITGFALGQSTIFNTDPTMVLGGPSNYGPWEFNPQIGVWVMSISIPNNPALVGSEWAAQSLALTAATMTFHLSGSHYVRII